MAAARLGRLGSFLVFQSHRMS
uniref:Uncharacterized protein n=1 Tax=Anguilla anguilla TaxID=7936 RepID=A0A0E9V507_ANGAN